MNRIKQYKRNEWIMTFVVFLMVVGGMVQTASANPYQNQNVTGAVLDYRFDENSGISVSDSTVNGFNANWYGTNPYNWTTGVYNSAGNFSTASTSRVTSTGISNKMDNFSMVVLWINVSTDGDVANKYSGTNGWGVTIESGRPSLRIYNGTTSKFVQYVTDIRNQGWTHLVFVANGTHSYIYVNGVKNTPAVYYNMTGAVGNNLNVGGSQFVGVIDADIDDFRIYNGTVWNDTQVMDDYKMQFIGNVQSYDPTFSTVHNWTFSPAMNVNSNTSVSLNDGSLTWFNNTNNFSFIINDTDSGFNFTRNNTVNISSYNYSENTRNTTLSLYINQTSLYYTTASSPGQYEVAPDGTLYRFYLTGVYNSTNNGTTWNTVTGTANRNFQSVGLNSILVYNSSTIFASNATYRNVSVSYDYGATWTQTLTDYAWAWNFVIYSGYVFAPMYTNNNLDNPNSSIFRTTDGTTWSSNILDSPNTTHVHGIGMVNDKMIALIGDNYSYNNANQLGIKVSSNPTAETPTWTQEITGKYQNTIVVNASGTAVFGGDSYQDSILSRDSNGRYSTSVYNITYRNAEYYGLYDPAEDVTYLLQALDLGVLPVNLLASPDKGKTWYVLFNTTDTGSISGISNDGYIYIKVGTDSSWKVKTINKTAITTNQKLITTIFAENALVNRISDTNYSVDNTYASVANITYYDTPQQEDLHTNGYSISVSAKNGSFQLLTDAIFDNNITNTVYPNGSVQMNIANNTQNSSLNFSIIPSSDSVEVTVGSWINNGRKAWTETTTNPSVTTSHVVGDSPANTIVYLVIDGDTSNFEVLQTNSTGWAEFTYNGGFSSSSHSFELDTVVADTTHSSIIASCNSAISWATTGFSVLVVLLLAAGGGIVLTMILTHAFDGSLLIRYVVMTTVIVIIGVLGLAIANPVVNLIGC